MKNETYKTQLQNSFFTDQLELIATNQGWNEGHEAFIQNQIKTHWNTWVGFSRHNGPGDEPVPGKHPTEDKYKDDQKRSYLIQFIVDGEISPKFRDPIITGVFF